MEQTQPIHLKLAQLNSEQKRELQQLEGELGALIMALEPQLQLRHLEGEDLARLRALESELGVILLAYEPV